MDRLSLVQLEDPVAVVLLDHPRVLQRGLALEEHAAVVDALDRADRDRHRQRDRDRDRDEPPVLAQAGRGDRGDRQGEGQNVRWVPMNGISTSAESIVPSSEPAVEIA